MKSKVSQVGVFLILQVLAPIVADQGIKAFNENLVKCISLIQVSIPEYFCHQLLSLLGYRHFLRLREAHVDGFSLSDGLIGRILLQQEINFL